MESGHVWLNAASEGPLPVAAQEALFEACRWKSSPHHLTFERFRNVPLNLKQALGGLLGVSAFDMILGNSASYGIHLLTQGWPFNEGDHVLVMRNDFPTDILPWMALREKGVSVIQLPHSGPVLTPVELREGLTDTTRIVCLPHVHTFSGQTLDIGGCLKVCEDRGIDFVVNVSQSAGAMPLNFDIQKTSVVLGAGYKWMLGPYGTGFCWIRPEIREKLNNNQVYWQAAMAPADFESEDDLELRPGSSARRFDMFATANFFNYVPWTESIRLLQEIGVDNVYAHIQSLLSHLQARWPDQYDIVTQPETNLLQSNLLIFSHRDPGQNQALYKYLTENRIYLALWKGLLRVSPHAHNDTRDMERLTNALRNFDSARNSGHRENS